MMFFPLLGGREVNGRQNVIVGSHFSMKEALKCFVCLCVCVLIYNVDTLHSFPHCPVAYPANVCDFYFVSQTFSLPATAYVPLSLPYIHLIGEEIFGFFCFCKIIRQKKKFTLLRILRMLVRQRMNVARFTHEVWNRLLSDILFLFMRKNFWKFSDQRDQKKFIYISTDGSFNKVWRFNQYLRSIFCLCGTKEGLIVYVERWLHVIDPWTNVLKHLEHFFFLVHHHLCFLLGSQCYVQ